MLRMFEKIKSFKEPKLQLTIYIALKLFHCSLNKVRARVEWNRFSSTQPLLEFSLAWIDCTKNGCKLSRQFEVASRLSGSQKPPPQRFAGLFLSCAHHLSAEAREPKNSLPRPCTPSTSFWRFSVDLDRAWKERKCCDSLLIYCFFLTSWTPSIRRKCMMNRHASRNNVK